MRGNLKEVKEKATYVAGWATALGTDNEFREQYSHRNDRRRRPEYANANMPLA